MNLLQTGFITKQVLGKTPTICKKCNKTETTKFYMDNNCSLPVGSFTKRCGCGTWVYKHHFPDEHNATDYYTKAFVSVQIFDKDYCKKNIFEREGFKKLNGKYVK
jgi:hypothetical protein